VTGEAAIGAPRRIWERVRPYRRYWLADVLVVLGLMLLTALLFESTSWDERLTARFYDAEAQRPFSLYREAPWVQLYHGIIWPIVGTVAVSFGGLLASLWKERLRRYRPHCLFLLLSLAAGPGLVVNLVLKAHWGRPRPVSTVTFGGTETYRSALDRGVSGGGASFPCGHCSVGFFLFAFYFLARRKRRTLRALILLLTVLLGLAVGAARVVAGAHYLSDVLWAAWIVFLVEWLLYYFILSIPEREDAGRFVRAPANKAVAVLVYAVLPISILIGAALANPIDKDIRLDQTWRADLPTPLHVVIEGDDMQATIHFEDGRIFSAQGLVHGFGLEFDGMYFDLNTATGTPSTLTFRLDPKGFFPEFGARIDFRLPRTGVERLHLKGRRSEYFVHGASAAPQRLSLDVEEGDVHLPPGWE
jgi:lipid A 4'-phosphatase